MEAALDAARRRYNELYPDQPIKRVGDTPDAYYYLVGLSIGWIDGKPLAAVEIAAIGMMTPRGMFSGF